MAKKTNTGGAAKGSLLDMIMKFDNTVEVLSESKYSIIREYISTGNYIVNAAATGSLFGGVPTGRVFTLAGEEGSGKTYLALSICRNAQYMNYTPIYIDTEGSLEDTFVKRLGIDTGRDKNGMPKFIIKSANKVSEISTFIANLCRAELELPEEERHKIILVLDSLGNLTTDKEFDDTMDGSQKRDMTRAQEIKKMFRVNMVNLNRLQIPFIVNNHIYSSTDMYAGKSESGGCLIPTERIITSAGNKAMKDIKVGDYVLTEDGTYKSVTRLFTFEKHTIKFTFEDQTEIECSREHKFLVPQNSNYNPDDIEESKGLGLVWKEAQHIVKGDYVREIRADKKYGWLKVEETTPYEEPKIVNDITVDDIHSYVSANGVINHNSGIKYNSSVTFFLSSSKLEDKASEKIVAGQPVEAQKVGVVVSLTPKKNRFTIPHKVRFQIPYYKSPNPYVGLEQFLTWENSGIIPGKIVTDKEYAKMNDADKSQCHEMTDKNGNHCYGYCKPGGRKIVVQHLGEELPMIELWTSKVLTDEILHRVDDMTIRPIFELPNQSNNADLNELLEDSDDDTAEI